MYFNPILSPSSAIKSLSSEVFLIEMGIDFYKVSDSKFKVLEICTVSK